jgi:quinol monooxygenase YgiN
MTDAAPSATATSTVRLIPVFEAKPGSEHELARLLSELQAASRRDAGCVEYLVFRDDESPNTFVLYEEWTSSAALDAHNELQHVTDFLAAAEPLLARKLSVYRPGTV